jgi:hypothetical protein
LAQYVDLVAEVRIRELSAKGSSDTRKVHVVVGTNSWRMDGDLCSNCEMTYWFTGDRIIQHSKVTKMPPTEGLELTEAEKGRLLGTETTKAYECSDGNPSLSRSAGESDRLDLLGRVAWLAFCSGSYLQREGRQVFPTSDLWKELIQANAFTDLTIRFKDDFGLPSRMDLYTTNSLPTLMYATNSSLVGRYPANSSNVQPVLQYRILGSTNILGWNFPLEFKVIQYRPALPGSRARKIIVGTNGWEIQFTATGKVSTIGAVARSPIPEYFIKGRRKMKITSSLDRQSSFRAP